MRPFTRWNCCSLHLSIMITTGLLLSNTMRADDTQKAATPTSSTAPHITFPEFVGRGKRSTPPIIQPASPTVDNEVITARVELYYYRDAHRVAQLINRNTQSYNAAAVTLQERAAEDAREAAEVAKSNRREAEFQAEKASRELREKKNELALMVGELRQQLTPRTNDRDDLLAQKKIRENDRRELQDEQKRLLARKAAIEGDGQEDSDQEIVELRNIKQRLTEISASITAKDNEISDLQTRSDGITLNLEQSRNTVQNLVKDVSRLEDEVSQLTLKAQQAIEAEEKAARACGHSSVGELLRM